MIAVTGAAMLIRGRALAELGGWPELYDFYYEDVHLCLRAWSLGWRVTSVRNAVAQHEVSATAIRARRPTWSAATTAACAICRASPTR